MRNVGLIAVIGRPNVGKSTLLNCILGEEISIVTPKPQTTRERILGIYTIPKGQMVFVDTPGIHRTKPGGLNESMVLEARQALTADLIWYLVDPHSSKTHEQVVVDLLKKVKTPFFMILNKQDLFLKPELLFNQNFGIFPQKKLSISALKGTGVQELLESSWPFLPQGPLLFPDEEMLSNRPIRFFVAEKIREQLYLQLGEELPYSCAVQILKFEEDKKPLFIEAVLFVERESQKGMVIGNQGKKIKLIGQAARQTIEAFLEKSVYLHLQVKVLNHWTRDQKKIKWLGYNMAKK